MKVFAVKFVSNGAWSDPFVVKEDTIAAFLTARVGATTSFSVEYVGDDTPPAPTVGEEG